MRPLSPAALPLVLAVTSCAPVDAPPDVDEPVERTAFSFEPIALDGVPTRWGSPVAPGIVFGGVDGEMRVQADVFTLSADDDTLRADVAAVLPEGRFCGCAIHDTDRNELLVLGGRDAQFRDEPTALVIDLATQAQTVVETSGALDFPVGCQSFYAPTTGKGYVFGGLSSGTGFSGDTWRWDPEARTFTRLDIASPAGRYDAGVMELADGTVLMAGGMGGGLAGVVFFSDVWRFDPADETWTEIAATTAAPPGRRYPWTALSPDGNTLVYGFGSDSARGESVLGDMWRFDVATGAWAELDVEGELPAARGFTYRVEGPENTAGVLVGGSDASLAVHTDAFVLRVPTALEGEWR